MKVFFSYTKENSDEVVNVVSHYQSDLEPLMQACLDRAIAETVKSYCKEVDLDPEEVFSEIEAMCIRVWFEEEEYCWEMNPDLSVFERPEQQDE